MDLLRVAGATLNQTALDFEGNVRRIIALLRTAKRLGVELLCLPELCITGYGCEDAFFSLSTAQRAIDALEELLPETAGLTVVVGLPYFYRGAMYNCAALVQDRQVIGLNAKRVLPREGVHYEARWFRPWSFGKVVQVELFGRAIPFGDLRYRLGDLGVGIEICEEAWDSVPASVAHADAVDLVLNPSASHFALGKAAKREHLVANSSRSLHVIYVYTNLLGVDSGRLIYDGGVLFAAGGEVIGRGRRFGFDDGETFYLDVDPNSSRLAKLRETSVREGGGAGDSFPAGQEVQGEDPRLVARRNSNKSLGALKTLVRPASSPSAMSREVEFLHAEMLGLFDYLRKSRSRGFVLSLSGGCDSACCAVLVAHMLAAAVKELGMQVTCERLGLSRQAPSVQALVGELLTCVYQGTVNSGDVTRQAAEAVAKAVHATFYAVDVEGQVAAYRSSVEGLIGRSLQWETDDLSLQNIQARTRAPLVWMLANVKGAVLLTTSNRSEAAVGYATMDGDTAGGLAPLGGIDKHFLRRWLVWAEAQEAWGLGKLPALIAVNRQAPTAELRPKSQAQSDESDLMPYDLLARIEQSFIRDRLGPTDIVDLLVNEFPKQTKAELQGAVEKFLRLWGASQWKRERFAPSFHLDDLSLDPKTWCRFPILSGVGSWRA